MCVKFYIILSHVWICVSITTIKIWNYFITTKIFLILFLYSHTHSLPTSIQNLWQPLICFQCMKCISMYEIIQYVSFWDWIPSLSIMPSTSIQVVVVQQQFILFYCWECESGSLTINLFWTFWLFSILGYYK